MLLFLLILIFDTVSIPKSVHKIKIDTYRITIDISIKIS